jgi:hypothetical protein
MYEAGEYIKPSVSSQAGIASMLRGERADA